MPGPKKSREAIAAAIAKGSKYYFGRPCKRGHPGERSVTYNQCRQCAQERTRLRWTTRDGAERRQSRHWSRIRSAQRFGYEPPPHEKDCRAYPSDQLCEICRRPEKNGRRLSLDHDHVTGAFRGWVCHHCNMLIGKFEKYGIEFLVAYFAGEYSEKVPPERQIGPPVASYSDK